jgi:hypothetical protein
MSFIDMLCISNLTYGASLYGFCIFSYMLFSKSTSLLAFLPSSSSDYFTLSRLMGVSRSFLWV